MEPRGTVLPIYFVADESMSMSACIRDLNDGLTSLLAALQGEPFAASKVRLSVIGFAEDAVAYLRLADMRSLAEMPVLRARGSSTSFRAAFDQVGACISADIPSLKSQGFLVNRPVVFFLTDGVPDVTEDWLAARDYLLARPTAPNILSFGIGEAQAASVARVSTKPDSYAFLAAHGADTGSAVMRFMTALTESVVSSGQAIASGGGALRLERPKGFSLAAEMPNFNAVQPGPISIWIAAHDVVGAPSAFEVEFNWDGGYLASFAIGKGILVGEVSWRDGQDLELTFDPRRRDAQGPQFIIRGAAPTFRNPTSKAEIRDIQFWLRLGYELQVVVEEERIGKWNWGKSSTRGGPKIRVSNIKPYVPSY
jgi:uncharacterized protein YegL